MKNNDSITAVQWLFNQLEEMQYFIGNDLYSAYKQALELEKQQIVRAFDIADNINTGNFINGIDYYKQEYEAGNAS